MIDPIETSAPLVGSDMQLLAVVSTTNYELVDNVQLKYAHLRILQVSLIISRHYVKLNYIL